MTHQRNTAGAECVNQYADANNRKSIVSSGYVGDKIRPVFAIKPGAIGDISLHNATGDAPWWYRPVGSLFDQFLGAAETDPVLAEWFLRRFSLLDSLYMIPTMRLVGRTIRHNARLWLAEKRASAPARAGRHVPSATR